jgi:hypothetical protein
MHKIDYRYGNNLDLDHVIELYHASTLASVVRWTTGKP